MSIYFSGKNHFMSRLYLGFRHTFIRIYVCCCWGIEFVLLHLNIIYIICLALDTYSDKEKEETTEKEEENPKKKIIFHQVERSCTFIAQSTVSINCLYCQLHSNDDSTSFFTVECRSACFLFPFLSACSTSKSVKDCEF